MRSCSAEPLTPCTIARPLAYTGRLLFVLGPEGSPQPRASSSLLVVLLVVIKDNGDDWNKKKK